MAEQTTSKKKHFLSPKVMKFIAITLAGIGIVFFIFSQIFSSRSRVQLIERTQQVERDSATDTDPDPDVYEKNVRQVLGRSTDTTTTMALELGAFDLVLNNLPSEVTYSQVELQNFLGGNKLHVELTIDDVSHLASVQSVFEEACETYLVTYPEIVRIYYNFYTETETLSCGYYVINNGFQNVENMPYPLPSTLGSELAPEDVAMQRVSDALSDFLTVDYELNMSTDGSKYLLDLAVNTAGSMTGLSDCLDVFDRLFFLIQEDFDMPVQLMIHSSTDLVASAYIVPGDKLFAAFYTDKEFYQDISRAEYYLCNEWLLGSLEQSLASTLNDLA